jgi:hypothetical protein
MFLVFTQISSLYGLAGVAIDLFADNAFRGFVQV